MLKRIVLVLLVILMLFPAAVSAQQATGKVTGTVTYREQSRCHPPHA